jgi:hypothetical protein
MGELMMNRPNKACWRQGRVCLFVSCCTSLFRPASAQSLGGSPFDLCVMIPCWRCRTAKEYMETIIQLIVGESQTLFLCGLGLLSFVLPFTAMARAPKETRIPRTATRTVWAGELVTGLGALLIICLPTYPVLGFAFAIVSLVVFTLKLRRQLPVAHAA